MELSNRKALIDRARYLMNKYLMTELEALNWAYQELEEQIKKEGEQ